jgi:hypothetical protein
MLSMGRAVLESSQAEEIGQKIGESNNWEHSKLSLTVRALRAAIRTALSSLDPSNFTFDRPV